MSLRFLALKTMGQKRDWEQYNKQLVNRGKIHFWINPEVIKYSKASKLSTQQYQQELEKNTNKFQQALSGYQSADAKKSSLEGCNRLGAWGNTLLSV